MIARGTHDAVLSKLAVLCINCVCSKKETVVADLFKVCHITTINAVIELTLEPCEKKCEQN